MNNQFDETDLSGIKPIPISERKSKLSVDQIVDPVAALGGEMPKGTGELLALLPDVLAADAVKKLVAALQAARNDKREIIWLVGAHTIKCGLSLFINALIDAGYITTVATTGSSTIHDLELAFFGKTSEFVEEELTLGRFGMAGETADHFAASCHHAYDTKQGLGAGVGDYIAAQNAPHQNVSVFHKASQAGVPATVHVAFGTDITHQHPSFPAERVGGLTMKDFRILTSRVERAFDRGVIIVFGSAVVLPEVFLKAVSINYNLGHRPTGVTTASFDMLPQYRVRENVLGRPFHGSGESYAVTGHHEIMLPLLYLLLSA